MNRIGIDFGGTKIEGIILDDAGKELFRKRVPTQQELGYESILNQIKSLYLELAKTVQDKSHTLGIGTPGAVSRRTGLLKNSNTVCLNGKPFYLDLKKLLGRDFRIENDANCFAMAEALYGAAQGKEMVFGVIMGTGCGGGIVYQGKVITGLQSIAGEWGHMSIDPEGPECYCKSRGCVETLISGGGLEKRFEERLKRETGVKEGKKPFNPFYPFSTPFNPTPLKEIVEMYRKEDERAASFMKTFFKNFGRAMANLINILDPDIVVLGGGVSNIDELYTEGIEEVRKQVFSDSLETVIVKNKLGDSSGVMGAALIGI